MFLDDTDTADEGSWEVILYGSGENRDSNHSASWPGIDVARGLRDDLELSFDIARQVADGEPVLEDPEDPGSAPSGDRETGLGNLAVGVKWRLLDDGHFELALSPSLSFPLSGIAQLRGLIEDATVLELPVIAAWGTDRWQLRGQLGYDWVSREADTVIYGVALSVGATERLRLHGEIYGFEFVNSKSAFRNWRLGFEWTITDRLDLLAAYGGPVSSNLPPEDQLEEDYYLGLLIRL